MRDVEKEIRDLYGPEAEVRTFTAEVRAVKEDGKLRGYAAVFNSLSENLGGFREKISQGAFADAIGKSDIRALVNHDPNLILGRTKSGTLRVSEDERGLVSEIDPPDTQAGRDIMASVGRGDIDQMSFAFRVAPDGETWAEDDDGTKVRTLTKIAELFDVSPVTYPAYPATVVSARAREMAEAKPEEKGLSLAMAEAIQKNATAS